MKILSSIILDSLRYIAIFIAILGSLLFSMPVYGQNEQPVTTTEEAKEHYENGINKLKTGKSYIDKLKQKLPNLIKNIYREQVQDGQQLLNVENPETRDEIFAAKRSLGEAIEEFKKAIKLNQDYSDAYIKLADAYLEMGNEADAISIYEAGLQNKYDSLTIPFSELKTIFHDIAMVYFTSKNDSDKKVIEEFINLANKPFQDEYDQLDSKYNIARRSDGENIMKETLAKMVKNEIDRMINELELIKFFIATGRKEEAEKEYEKKKREYSVKLGFYNDADAQLIKDEYTKIDRDLEANSEFELTLDQNLLGVGEKGSITLMPAGDYSENLRFFRLVLMSDKVLIKFLNHNTFDKTNNHIPRIIPANPPNEYIARIAIPKLEVKKDNVLPFKMTLKRNIDKPQNSMTSPYINDKTKLYLKGDTGSRIEIDFGLDGIFSNPEIMELDSKFGVTSGFYEAIIETSFQVKKSQTVSLSIIELKTPFIIKEPEQPKQADFVIKPQVQKQKNTEEKVPKPANKSWRDSLPDRRAMFIFAMVAMAVIMIAISWGSN